MNNYQQPGDVLELTAPAGGVTSGVPVQIGQLLVIPAVTVAATVAFNGQVVGVFKAMPKATGANFWLALIRTRPPLIDPTTMDIFTCPVSGEEDGICRYWGPGKDINDPKNFGDGDPVGMCDDPGHGDSVIILRKSGDVMSTGRSDPLYKRARKILEPPEDD